MRSLRSYLPNPDDDRSSSEWLSVRITPYIRSQLDLLKKKNRWTLSDMIRAGLNKLIDDEKPAQESFQLKKLDFDPQTTLNKSSWK